MYPASRAGHKGGAAGLTAGVPEPDNLAMPSIPGDAAGAPRCLFVNTYYPGFLESHYARTPGLAALPYEDQKRSLQETFFGDSDFYSRGLREAGWWADEIIVNCEPLQRAWASGNGSASRGLAVALDQVAAARPDVVYLQDLGLATRDFLEALRSRTRVLVGQIASPVPPAAHLKGLDLIVSSFPHFAEDFSRQGMASVYQPLAFDRRVWDRLPKAGRPHGVTFVGGISPAHAAGTAFLEKLAGGLPSMRFFGYGCGSLPPASPIRKAHGGEAWGLEMFSLLAASAITVNRHIDVAGRNANNMRLFEATGCGALLVTDYKDNLHELFEIGEEVVAYRSPEECLDLIRYYQAHPGEAERIARAGQERTFREHSYILRMRDSAVFLGEALAAKRRA